jgi:hypothetical protein
MLAYIFWHWPYPQIDTADYERDQLAFQWTLARAGPTGFRESAVYRIAGAPWLPAGRAVYEDWYLVDDFGSLGPLNDAVVAAVAQAAHDQAAAGAEAGAGALYRLRSGQPRLDTALLATWITKPRDLTYADFDARLAESLVGPAASLWRRQMVLGPAPEFCLLAPSELELPAGLTGPVVRRERLTQ